MPTITINGKKHTPSSGTLKKMKRKAAMEAAAKAGKPTADKPKGKKAKMEAPTPRPRSERPKKKPVEGLRVPQGPTMTKLKGKVKDLPSRKKPITKGGRTGDMTKGGAAKSAQYIKMRKQLGTGK